MFAMMLAMLALMAVMGVGLSRLLMTTKATTQMQRTQDNKQLLNSVLMTLSSKAEDSDGDFVLEPPPMDSVIRFSPSTQAATGLVSNDVANTDAWGRRLGYCGYDWGNRTIPLGPTDPSGLIHSYTPLGEQSSPPDSAVAIIVVSAGPDGVFNMPDGTVMTPSNRPFCFNPIDSSVTPNTLTASSKVVAGGDDMVAARSYGEMVSFGNAQIASTLSGLGTNATNKLCRLGSDGKMICDISTDLSSSNTANKLCRTDASGTLQCSADATTCAAGQVSKWNGSSFECVAASLNITGSGGICRKDGIGNVVCDINTNLVSSNTANRLCYSNASGVLVCDFPSYLGQAGNMPGRGNCFVDGGDGHLRCSMCNPGETTTWFGPPINFTICAPNGWTDPAPPVW
jgi:hypothetical protein